VHACAPVACVSCHDCLFYHTVLEWTDGDTPPLPAWVEPWTVAHACAPVACVSCHGCLCYRRLSSPPHCVFDFGAKLFAIHDMILDLSLGLLKMWCRMRYVHCRCVRYVHCRMSVHCRYHAACRAITVQGGFFHLVIQLITSTS